MSKSFDLLIKNEPDPEKKPEPGKNEPEKKPTPVEPVKAPEKPQPSKFHKGRDTFLNVVIFLLIISIAIVAALIIREELPKRKVSYDNKVGVVSPIPSPSASLSPAMTSPSPEPTVSETPSASPSATPIAKDKSSLAVMVFNGTGITGQAAQFATILKNAGYKNVKTGNSETKTNKTTIIYYDAGLKDAAEQLKTDLGKTATLEEKETAYDIQILTGSN